MPYNGVEAKEKYITDVASLKARRAILRTRVGRDKVKRALVADWYKQEALVLACRFDIPRLDAEVEVALMQSKAGMAKAHGETKEKVQETLKAAEVAASEALAAMKKAEIDLA